MKNLNYRNLYEEITEKEKPTLISTERKVKRLCKSGAHKPSGAITLHRKEVFSDGCARAWQYFLCTSIPTYFTGYHLGRFANGILLSGLTGPIM